MSKRILFRPGGLNNRIPKGFKSLTINPEIGSIELITSTGSVVDVEKNPIIKLNSGNFITSSKTLSLNIIDQASSMTGSVVNGTQSQLIFNNTISINNNIGIKKLEFGPTSRIEVSKSSDTVSLTVKSDIPYKTYRAKLKTEVINWPGYGYLYNWYAIQDSRKLENPNGGTGLIAPNEWRVPNNSDWDILKIRVTLPNISGNSGLKLKSELTSESFPFRGWLNDSYLARAGTNEYNFGALPGGWRVNQGGFGNIGSNGIWWSSTIGESSIFYQIAFNSSDIFSTVTSLSPSNKSFGYSVRLVRLATGNELLLTDGDTSETSSLQPYIGNDGKSYVTVKIGTQIWLAQNLRETKYYEGDIFNASILGGDPNNSTWEQKGVAQEGAWTVYRDLTLGPIEFEPFNSEEIYTDVLENTLGSLVNWESLTDGNNPFYRATTKSNGSNSNRNWYKTNISVTPCYDEENYNNTNQTLIQKSLIVKSAVSGETNIDFFPIKISSTGNQTIESLNSSKYVHSQVLVEILEYQPNLYGYYGGGSDGYAQAIGFVNL